MYFRRVGLRYAARGRCDRVSLKAQAVALEPHFTLIAWFVTGEGGVWTLRLQSPCRRFRQRILHIQGEVIAFWTGRPVAGACLLTRYQIGN